MGNKRHILQFDFEGNIGPIKSSVLELQKSLKGIRLPDNIGVGLDKTFSKLASEFENFEAIVKTGFDDIANVSKAEKSFGKISNLVNQLSIQAGSIQGLDPKKLIPQESLERLKGLEKAWAAVREESEKKSNVEKEIEKQTKEIQEQEKALQKLSDQYDKLAAKNKLLGSQKGAKVSQKNAAEGRRNQVVAALTELEGQKGGKSSIKYKELNQEYSSLSATIKSLESDIRKLDAELNDNKVEMAGLDTEVESANEAYKKMQDQLSNLKNIQITPKGLVELRTEIAKLTGMNIQEVPQDLGELQQVINNLTDNQLEEISKALVEIKSNTDGLSAPLANAKEGVENLGEAGREVTRTANEIENLKRQVLDFFSLTNSVQLFKRAVTSALNTVKELDATMTEAAVVTEFDIGDMWEKLPEYAKNAQDLGVSINGMYQATTLYYQQGLKNQEAMELGIETMKMGKIAGMESAEATQAMTAALRGFNMELNQASATKVNDVYSQLAAVTAADTNQIATAMEKTASIAASANMEFETTAALLAQIIETTQEAPETAGTAMKTIIARFAEVKSLREQGLISGEDEEGEIIDVNKIQTALRSVGISMEGFFSGKEGLDSILLKLSEKWSDLDFETQRYIATMAAGSRQQSRFIAMMSDYKRTTELVGEAQNSAGASQKQFEKTQESLATSLQRLENAWKEFLMGLANNEILKAGVDGLTKILETINKITEGISGGNGLLKSVVSLAGVLATLSTGKTLLNGTAVDGAMSGIVGKLTGGATGTPNGKTSIWARPGEIAAQRKEARAQWPKQFKRTITSTTYSNKDKSELQRRIGFAATTAEKKGTEDAAQLRALHDEIKKGNITVEEAQKKFSALNENIKGLGETTQKTVYDFNAMGQAASTAGMALTAAGAATSLLASAFESWGMEGAAEAMQTISGVLMTLGPILMGIGSFLPTLTGLTAAQAAATWAAVWPVLAIVAALGALVAIIAVVAEALHNSSLEGRMEAAAEATEQAKEAAESAKQAYDDLLSARTGYDELQDQLNSLTKGTLEWKEALVESNQKVLELIKTYPKLAQYLARGEHGELEISDAGWEAIEKQQRQGVQNSNAVLVYSQMEETRLQQEKARRDLEANPYTSNTSALDAIYKEYQKKGADLFKMEGGDYSQALKDLVDTTGLFEDTIYALKDAIIEYDNAMSENELKLQAQQEALLTGYLSEEALKNEYSDEIVAGFSKGLENEASEEGLGIMKDLFPEGKNGKVRDSEKFKEMATDAGVSSNELTGNNLHDLEVLYAKMKGIKPEEIEDGIKGNQIKLMEEISKMQALKEKGQETDKIVTAMSNLDKDIQKEYAAMIGKNVDLMSNDVITKYTETSEVELKQMASRLGLTLDQLAQKLGTTVDQLDEEFEKWANNTKTAFDEVNKKIGKITGDQQGIPDAFSKASLGDLKSYAQLLSQAQVLGSEKIISDGFTTILESESMTKEQADKLVDTMDTFDWTKEGAGEEFLKILKEIAPNIDTTTNSFKNFANSLKQVNAIYRKLDWVDMADKLTAGFEEADQVAGQSELTNEQFQKYLEEGWVNLDEWVFNGKGWVNVTNGMDNLVDAIKKNTIAQYDASVVDAQAQVDYYEKMLKKLQIEIGHEYDAIDGKAGIFYTTSTGGVGFTTDPRGKQQLETRYSNKILTNEQLIEALGTGKAEESVWTQFFGSEDEYKKWVDLYKGDYKKAQMILDISKKFDPEAVQYGDEKDPYDQYYNVYELLAAEARKRERLEKYRNRLLEEGNGKLARENREKIRQSLETERFEQQKLADYYWDDIAHLVSDNMDLVETYGIDLEKLINGDQIYFDVAKVNGEKGSTREKIDEFIKALEENRDAMVEAQNNADDLGLDLDELDKEDRQAYIDAFGRIKEALLQERQDEIDALKDINDSINDTNSKILNSLQEQINDQRQARDNAKTEQELEDKQRRLMFLQQDTSGANATEILKLQKEIEEGQESYTDQLIDQKISELQKQNDEAAEQRERQIELLEAQKEIWEQGAIWQKVTELFEGAIVDGKVDENSELFGILKNSADFDAMSSAEKEQFVEEMFTLITSAFGVKYATGGLVTSTGPAWLDGTSSRPEYVLSADQTQAFFSLIDVLGSLGLNGNKTTQNNGDINLDIDINVENIADTMDLDRIANYIEQKIVDSASYRNTNLIK